MQQLTIKGLLDTPTAATCPKGVTTGFACPNAAKPAPLKDNKILLSVINPQLSFSLKAYSKKQRESLDCTSQQDFILPK